MDQFVFFRPGIRRPARLCKPSILTVLAAQLLYCVFFLFVTLTRIHGSVFYSVLRTRGINGERNLLINVDKPPGNSNARITVGLVIWQS